MKGLQIFTLWLFFAAVFSETAQAAIILGTSALYNKDIKKTKVPINNNDFKKLNTETITYWGGGGFVEIPFLDNTFGFLGHASLLYSFHDIYLNQYTIENYEFYRENPNTGEKRATFSSFQGEKKDFGELEDKNISENLEQHIRNSKNFNQRVAVEDFTLYAAAIFKFNFPTHIPWWKKHIVVRYITFGLNVLNPWIGGGFSNVMVNRSFKGIGYVYDKKILNIVGSDPAPDPDFYVMYGGGLNLKIPYVELLGTQILLVIELMMHHNLSPDDSNKPFDDAYRIEQGGYTIRFGMGMLLQ